MPPKKGETRHIITNVEQLRGKHLMTSLALTARLLLIGTTIVVNIVGSAVKAREEALKGKVTGHH